jgi:hypothetical protein
MTHDTSVPGTSLTGSDVRPVSDHRTGFPPAYLSHCLPQGYLRHFSPQGYLRHFSPQPDFLP